MGLLLDTKLRPPRLREGHVTRPRLLAQLDRGLGQGLILITAPAGYGKTSLAVEWLGQRPFLTTAWLSLDETDNDLDVFLRYLTTAVHNAFPQERPCATTHTLLNATQTPPLETVANALINDLSQLPHPLLLALDDYHLITDPSIQQVMAALVRHLPETLQLLLITRVDPALPLLARRRAQQRLLEVRAADLRFALAEARTILDQTSGAAVDEATAVLLEEQTEGWIIGLQMAGLSLREQIDPAAFARAFQERHHRLIMDFLFDEVLAHQPRAVWEFLLQTAVLEQFCAPLCDAVIGQQSASAESLLPHLIRSDLFLVSLDEQGRWYRYHHLFRDLLQRRLAQECEPEEIAALHRRAGGWLAKHGYTEAALRHSLAAGDLATAVTLIEERRHDMLNQGEIHRLNRWLGLLPEEVVTGRPALLQLKAWMLRWQAKFQTIPALLQQAESLLAQETEMVASGSSHPDILRGERDVLRSEMAFFQNEFQRSLTYAQSALDRLPGHYYFARGLAALFQLISQQSLGQTESALRQLTAWLDDEQLQHHIFRYALLLAAGAMYGANGDLKRLEQTCKFLLKLRLAEGRPLSITWASYFLGHVYYQWNRLDEAYAHWSAVLDWRYQANFRVYHETMLGLALLRHSQGEETEARQTLDELTQALLEMNQVQFMPETEAFRARLALLRGDVGAAVHWTQSGAQPARLPLWYWEGNELTRVKALLAQGTAVAHQEAADLLAACRQYAEKTSNVWLLIQIWALLALLARAQGQTEEALAAAEQAVRLAEPGGYLRLFAELGPDMADLLAQVAKRGVAPDYIGRILAVFPNVPTAEPDLTRREAEILALLQQGLSNKEIAGRLFLSVLTVKRHNRNIYLKLGVNGRRQAIAKAKTLNLLT
jgi:LuxR family transcriptional regulator, maltose regulon positive regulatory protein